MRRQVIPPQNNTTSQQRYRDERDRSSCINQSNRSTTHNPVEDASNSGGNHYVRDGPGSVGNISPMNKFHHSQQLRHQKRSIDEQFQNSLSIQDALGSY